jgi:hypothetical protein
MATDKNNNHYSADQIQVLEGLEPVRKRPGMYIGSTGERGLHQLIYEVVDNSIDEALAGFCDTIKLTINEDNSVQVVDNGRGIPIETNKKTGKSTLETVLTVLHAGGKFDNDAYKVSGGLHGVGVSCVNALSDYLVAEVNWNGKKYRQRYERGIAKTEVELIGNTKQTGTSITFSPDPTIFDTLEFNYTTIKHRMRELAFLNKGIKIILEDKRNKIKNEFHYEGGIKEFVRFLNSKKEPLHNDVIYTEVTRDKVIVEFAIQYTDSYNENIFSFVNNINTIEGGTHLVGFKTALTRGHRYDQECLEKIIHKENAYIGMIGSRLRVKKVLDSLEEKGIPREKLDKVYTPIGLKIGAETPAEIAVSIMAEIIEVKNKKAGFGAYSNELINYILNEENDIPKALVTIVSRKGSSPRDVGTKMIVSKDGTMKGTIGGGCVEADIRQTALSCLDNRECRLVKVDMTGQEAEDDGMVCGGIIEIFVEPVI